MAHRLSYDSLESTRIALLKLEHCCSDYDETAVTYLRHEFLSRLADLEAALAIIQHQALFGISGIVRHPSFDELQTLEEDSASIPPHKLD
jgi:hypothetical protein